MINPTCVYTEKEVMDGIGIRNIDAFNSLFIRPVGGDLQAKGDGTDLYLGVDVIRALYRERGEEPPEFTSVVRAAGKQPRPEPIAKPGPIHPNQTYTVKEAAERLSRSTWTVRKRIKEKKIPAVKDGKDWLIREEDLEAFIAGLPANRKRPPKPRRVRLTKGERERIAARAEHAKRFLK